MRATFALLLAGLGLTLPVQAQKAVPDPAKNCNECHGAEGLAHADSVHAAAGISCIDCHGGSAGWLDAADAHGEDLRALRDPQEAVASCAACHSDLERMRAYGLRTDQESLYWSSQHGQALAKGDTKVATCVSCHGPHRILRATDPRARTHKQRQPETCGGCHADKELMAPYGIATDVVEHFLSSVHGRSLLEGNHLASPSCTDCHGSHGATPPKVQDVGRVCGHCHTVVRDAFEQSPHFAATLEGGMEECISCHGHHDVQHPDIDMLVGDGPGHCARCHSPGVGTALEVADRLHTTVTAMEQELAAAHDELRKAADRGLFIGSMLDSLDDARGLHVRARPVLHQLAPEALVELKQRADGRIQHALEDLDKKKRELRDNKIYTTIFFVVVVTLALGLIAYRREAFDRLYEGATRGSRSGG